MLSLLAAHAAAGTSREITAAADLIARLVGPLRSAAFELSLVAGHADSFAITAGSAPGHAAISGTSGVALASGLNWYLKYDCRIEVSYLRV